MKPVYTHRDAQGMKWRFVGSRPVSELADWVTGELKARLKRESRRKTPKRKA